MATNETNPQVPTGHPTGFWFFFWGEFAERCSYYGMRAILALYMTDKLGISKEDAGTYMSLFIAACYFLPLLGGYIADNYLGKYWTIVSFSIPYVLGQILVGIENEYVLFVALCLLAMGSGVIKPNISTLMGLTYDQQRPGQDKLRSNAFSWFYFSINVGAALSQFALPYVRSKYDSYQIAFLIPAGFMTLALAIFAAGKPYYAKETIVRTRSTPEERALKWQILRRILGLFLLVMFFWAIFDQAASTWIFFADTYMNCEIFGMEIAPDAIQGFNPVFILCFLPLSVIFFNWLANQGIKIRATDKMVIGFILTACCMGIMSLTGFIAGEAKKSLRITTKEGTLILPTSEVKLDDPKKNEQKKQLESNLGSLLWDNLPLRMQFQEAIQKIGDEKKKKVSFSNGELQLANGKMLVFRDGRIDFTRSKPLFPEGPIDLPGTLEVKFKDGEYPFEEGKIVLLKNQVKIVPNEKPAQAAEKAEEKGQVVIDEIDFVPAEQRVTVWWQIFAYLIITIAEILISVTGLELAFTAAPASMKSFVTACWLATVFLANLLINAPITRLYPSMPPGYYFAMLAAAMLGVTVTFIYVARKFNANQDTTPESAQQKVAEAE